MTKEYIGKNVKEYRQNRNMTQEGLGEKAELHYTYIGQVERGEKNPSLTALEKIADALNIGLDKLLVDYDLSPEISVKISNITDLLTLLNKRELDLIYTFLKAIIKFFDKYKIEKKE